MKSLSDALDKIIEIPVEAEQGEKPTAQEFVMLSNFTTSVKAPIEIQDDYDPNTKPQPVNDPNLIAGTKTSVINKYVKERTNRDRWEDLIQLSKKYSDLKFLINTLHDSHRPGKFLKTLFSIGIVQMTITSIWCNPILAAGFAAYVGYVFSNDSKEKEYRDTKVTLGIGALLFNNISPFIFDPAKNTFLFMTYLYFSSSTWGVLTSSSEKTKLLSKITYLTGANAFVIESPFVYIGFLTLLEKGYIDDIIVRKFPNILVNNFLPTVKSSAKDAVTEYLLTITNVLKDSFETVIYLPYNVIVNILESRTISKEFVSISKN